MLSGELYDPLDPQLSAECRNPCRVVREIGQ
ncbi:MAG: maltose acetyltransferase domain-containing protein [Candidatus Rokuibacteriota bacterium]